MSTTLKLFKLLVPCIPDLIALAPAGEPRVILGAIAAGGEALLGGLDAPHVVQAGERFAEAMLPLLEQHLTPTLASVVEALRQVLIAIDQPPPVAA